MEPSSTPNVVVQNPYVRKVAGIVVGTALLVMPSLGLIETYSTLDFSAWLPAASQVTMFLAGVFGLAVTTPNVPTEKRARYGAQ